ncbi:ROK family transcriptional regulator [Paractinoplanes lichenicola]|uniref:ROK family transcriptional regulator n=1 Tax=Paractinoplanes lichenicola TaxID=2802976 RepID=A0ABS1VWF1_9ACTN|nr:ROK family transcriptional regulator [Actinoplanes lichenicola]MBL7258816.1 ROK family transcriptional regulator [Actinoplanes lichenicola]
MERRGSNLPRVGDYNQLLVLDLVRRHGSISRVELSERTGLSGQTVSNICRRLVAAGLIEPAGRAEADTGARRTMFRIVARGQFSIGLHIDPARMTLVLLNLAGEVEERASLVTPSGDGPEDLLRAVVDAVAGLAARRSDIAPRLVGLGVSTPGPILADAVIGPPNLRGWGVVRLRAELESRTGLPVVLEKDTIAAATGELWVSGGSLNDFAVIYLGTGIGAGIVLGGEVVRGSSDNLGEIGHLSGDPDGPRCPCGGRGCIAITCAPVHLVTEAAGQGLLPPVPPDDHLGIETALARLCALADDGDPAALAIVEKSARGIGRIAANLANVLDLDTIILGGPNWPALSRTYLRVAPPIPASLLTVSDVHTVEVRGTTLNEDGGAIGAASLVMSSMVSARSERLLLPR